MLVNKNINPRPLSREETENRKKGIYDSFANYLVFCPACCTPVKTNMYLQSAETYLEKLRTDGARCPRCGASEWLLGYPMGSKTGFVKEERSK